MKKAIFTIVLALTTTASAFDLPSLWWPEEFTSKWELSDAEMTAIESSKNVQAYLKKNKLGPIMGAAKNNGTITVFVEACSFDVVIKPNLNPAVRPVQGTLFCD